MKKLFKLLILVAILLLSLNINSNSHASDIETGVSIRLEKEVKWIFNNNYTFVITNNYEEAVTCTNLYLDLSGETEKIEINEEVASNSTLVVTHRMSKSKTIAGIKLYFTSDTYGKIAVTGSIDDVTVMNTIFYLIPLFILLVVSVVTFILTIIPRIRNKKLNKNNKEALNE